MGFLIGCQLLFPCIRNAVDLFAHYNAPFMCVSSCTSSHVSSRNSCTSHLLPFEFALRFCVLSKGPSVGFPPSTIGVQPLTLVFLHAFTFGLPKRSYTFCVHSKSCLFPRRLITQCITKKSRQGLKEKFTEKA